MTRVAPIHLSAQEVLSISDALVAVDHYLMRYHGRLVQLDAEPFKANFSADFKRLLRAKRALGKELTAQQRTVIVDALRHAHIAIALHEGNPLVDAQPTVNMAFGNAGELVGTALDVLAAGRNGDVDAPAQ
jgi:hypothetical protein